MIQTPDTNPLPEPDVRSEAHRLVQQLEQIQGKKALVLVVNSDSRQRDYLSNLFRDKGQEKGLGLVVSAKENPHDVINLYKAFREVDSLGNPNNIVLVVNRVLTPTPGVSVNIAQEIDTISKGQGWDMPLIVSSSTQDMWNMQMQKQFPNRFVGVYRNDSGPVLDALQTRL
ncbi:hypothetical protein A3J13_02045 [Candidatus Daviesbacteria bacterium RIFCSPLOWO2_02_FULL_36_8]|uniref:Uncharacterized protein n=1 Tax=Candidatus Daviesbacteria bacterium RIFCSPLOWO2_02_FULL_36_8 TaxID=1797793 RepID=A0A1F5MFX5_9BACT|nr:MAG: hypothetical protein A3J13_02045 [Candidatus Daviesbacteria bacterium RIFCSPLOWO2_02_FULL_36_8]